MMCWLIAWHAELAMPLAICWVVGKHHRGDRLSDLRTHS